MHYNHILICYTDHLAVEKKRKNDKIFAKKHNFERFFLNCKCKVWKSHEFSITQIVREINFGDSPSAKSAISTHLDALNFDF